MAHFESGELSQSRKTAMDVAELHEGNGAKGVASGNWIAAAGDLKSAGAARSFCNPTRETFWKGSREAGLLAIEQQLKSKFGRSVHLGREEGWACRECLLSRGQQLWREGEGSGLGAGEVPACTTTAARDGMPAHARTRWLTDQASSATIRTTPIDRLLAIADETMRSGFATRCDCYHMNEKIYDRACLRAVADGGSRWN